MDQKSSKGRRKRQKRGYVQRSNAVCVTVYDLTGRAIPERLVDEITQSIHAVAFNQGYVMDITRT